MHRPNILRFALSLAPFLGPVATLEGLDPLPGEAPRHSAAVAAGTGVQEAPEAAPEDDRERGYLGLSVQDTADGVAVSAVREGGGAAAAGVQEGDLLLSVDGQAIEDFQGLRERLDRHAVGDSVRLGLRRGDQELELTVVLGGPGALRRAHARFSEHLPADERLDELMRRREDFEREWQAELEEHLHELRKRFDRGWGELSDELGEALEERPEAAMRLREARAELNRWRDERHALLERLRSSLRGLRREAPWREGGDDAQRGPRAWGWFGPGDDGPSWGFPVPEADGEPQVWFFGPDGQRGKMRWRSFFGPDGAPRFEGRQHEEHEEHGPDGYFRWFSHGDADAPAPQAGRLRRQAAPPQPAPPHHEDAHAPHPDQRADAHGMADALGELRRELRDLREELRDLRRRLNER